MSARQARKLGAECVRQSAPQTSPGAAAAAAPAAAVAKQHSSASGTAGRRRALAVSMRRRGASRGQGGGGAASAGRGTKGGGARQPGGEVAGVGGGAVRAAAQAIVKGWAPGREDAGSAAGPARGSSLRRAARGGAGLAWHCQAPSRVCNSLAGGGSKGVSAGGRSGRGGGPRKAACERCRSRCHLGHASVPRQPSVHSASPALKPTARRRSSTVARAGWACRPGPGVAQSALERQPPAAAARRGTAQPLTLPWISGAPRAVQCTSGTLRSSLRLSEPPAGPSPHSPCRARSPRPPPLPAPMR